MMKQIPVINDGRKSPVSNQYIFVDDDGNAVFNSYYSHIAVYKPDGDDGKPLLTVGGRWDYSKTTMKYFSLFIRRHCPGFTYNGAADFRKQIENNPNILYLENWH
jgi:hypothetical protein